MSPTPENEAIFKWVWILEGGYLVPPPPLHPPHNKPPAVVPTPQ